VAVELESLQTICQPPIRLFGEGVGVHNEILPSGATSSVSSSNLDNATLVYTSLPTSHESNRLPHVTFDLPSGQRRIDGTTRCDELEIRSVAHSERWSRPPVSRPTLQAQVVHSGYAEPEILQHSLVEPSFSGTCGFPLLDKMLLVWQTAELTCSKEDAAVKAALCWPFTRELLFCTNLSSVEAAQISRRAASSCSDGTISAYRNALRSFLRTCSDLRLRPYPLSDEIILRYINHVVISGTVRFTSLKSYVTGILKIHLDGTGQPFIRSALIIDSMRSFARDDMHFRSVESVRQIFLSETLSAVLNFYYSQPSSPDLTAVPTMQFVDVAAITLATLTLLRSCQALDLTPAACSFGTNEIIGDYFEYIVPPHKVMAPGTYVPMKRSISCSRYYDSNLGEWYRLLRELHDRTNHSPDIPMLVTLGLSGTKTAESLTDALRRCLPSLMPPSLMSLLTPAARVVLLRPWPLRLRPMTCSYMVAGSLLIQCFPTRI